MAAQEITHLIAEEIVFFEEELDRTLQAEIPMVSQMVRYLARMKGKRFRPTLAILSARLVGEVSQAVLQGAAAIELVHTATLIHDDVVDASALRRGKPSVNALWGNPSSVLMGDFLLAKALRVLVGTHCYPAMEALAKATERMSQGEIFQIQQSGDLHIAEPTYSRIIEYKTAALISASCRIGGFLGGGSEQEVAHLGAFGERLGMGFQIADDLLDFVGTPGVSGKPVGNDFKGGYITLPLIHALSRCTPGERDRIHQKINAGMNGPEDWGEMVAFVQRWDGVRYAREKARQYGEEAGVRLNHLPPSGARDALRKIIPLAVERER